MGVRYRPDAARWRLLREELEAMLPRLIDERTVRVILFGSVAKGPVGAASDLDLLVVREDTGSPAQRVDELYRRVQPRVATDILVYTPDELSQALPTSSFLRTALRDGEVLYERSGTLA